MGPNPADLPDVPGPGERAVAADGPPTGAVGDHRPAPLEAFRLDGQTAIVTGAARGLGQALALGLAEGGANVAAVDIAPTEETARLVRNLGRRCHAVRADLAGIDPARAAALVDDVTAALARPTILVNNAGVIHRAPAVDHSQEAWNATLAVDLSAPFVLAQAFARPLLADGAPGKVVNVVSMLSFQGGLNVPAYAAAKSGLAGLTRALANEWAGHGINVNAIAPGYMATELTSALRADPERAEAMLGRIPAGRWGTPDDLKGAVVFLCSPAAAYVHGVVLPVDGGWLAW